MRPPTDMPRPPRPASRRRRRWIIAAAVIVIFVFASIRTFAVFYTDALWFSSVSLHGVWVTLFEIKAGLLLVFAAIFAAMLFASLVIAERLAPKGPTLDAEDEFVRRYREVIGPYSRWIRAIVVVVLSLIVGSQAVGQWQNWILFKNGCPFPNSDPQFHRNVGYFVCTLPFQQFLVHWALVALVVVLIVTLLSHYLNGGIRVQGPRPRVGPAVKAHISVILGLLALVKAVGYYLARFNLDLSGNGYVQGAGYTDVHARLPALELLILVSLAAAGLLIYNIRRRGWALPVLGVGLWFLVALFAGTIYPAAVQGLKVNPAQNTLEHPYIQRNIDATRTAMGIDKVTSVPYPATSTLQRAPAHSQQRHPRQRAPLGPDPDPGDVRPAPGHPHLLPVQFAGGRPVHDQRNPDPGDRRGARGQRPGPPFHLVGQHHSPVHPRLRDDRRPRERREFDRCPGLRRGRRPADLEQRPADDHPAVGLLRAQQRGLRGRQHQASGDRLPADQQQQRRDPLHRQWRCAVVVDLQAADVLGALQRHQPAHLQPDHRSVPHHVRPGCAGPGAKGGALPAARRRSLPGLGRRAHRLDPGRLHHHRQLPVRAERGHHCPPVRQRAQHPLQLRAQLGEGGDRRLHRPHDLLRDGPDRSAHQGLREGISRGCSRRHRR